MEENTITREEIMQRSIEDFSEVQQNMLLAKEEHAPKTYASLKRKYISLITENSNNRKFLYKGNPCFL